MRRNCEAVKLLYKNHRYNMSFAHGRSLLAKQVTHAVCVSLLIERSETAKQLI